MARTHFLKKFLKKNYIIVAFLAIVGITLLVAGIKLITGETTYVYARVKVSQGLWWASAQKPAIWLANNLQKGDVEIGLGGSPTVEVLEVRKYPLGIPNYGNEQYEVFLTLKMKVSQNERQQKYMFKRSALAVGSPVDLEFTKTQVSGTVMDLSEKPFKDAYVEREIELVKYLGYQPEFDAITVGSSYFDGEDTVFEVLDKSSEYTYEVYAGAGNNYPVETDKRLTITVRAKLKLKQENETLFFREDYPVQVGKKISVQTPSYFFDQYSIKSISE